LVWLFDSVPETILGKVEVAYARRQVNNVRPESAEAV
jgi:hypothetical protein